MKYNYSYIINIIGNDIFLETQGRTLVTFDISIRRVCDRYN